MAATVKAPAAKRRPPPHRPALPPAMPEPPGLLHFASADAQPEEREPLFYVDDAEYTIPVDPGPGIALEALHIMAGAAGAGDETAQAQAEDYILTQMLGEQGWADLRRCVREKIVSRKDFAYLTGVISERAMGAVESPNS